MRDKKNAELRALARMPFFRSDPRGSLNYDVTVPDGGAASLPWRATSRGESGERNMLGVSPTVGLEDVEVRPGVQHTRIKLLADSEAVSDTREVMFRVDRRFATMLRAGDVLHIGSGSDGGIGLSVLRGQRLVAAAGTVTAVPLGDEIKVSSPGDLRREAEAAFQRRDPTYYLRSWPIEVETEGETLLMDWGLPTLGAFKVHVWHGFRDGKECVGIARVGVCPDSAASLTAEILDQMGYRVVPYVTAIQMREENELKARDAVAESRRLMATGDLEEAFSSIQLALLYDRDCDDAWELFHVVKEAMARESD